MPEVRHIYVGGRLGLKGWILLLLSLALIVGIAIAVAVLAVGLFLILVPTLAIAAGAYYLYAMARARSGRSRPTDEPEIIDGEFRIVRPGELEQESIEEPPRRGDGV